MLVSEILDKAADLIEPEGAWTQDAWFLTKTGKETQSKAHAACMCAEGAIAVAAKVKAVHVWKTPAYEALAAIIGNGDIAEWNDAHERTQQEVVTALREAARKEREAGR